VKEAYQPVRIVTLDYSRSEVVEEVLVAEKSSTAAKSITMNSCLQRIKKRTGLENCFRIATTRLDPESVLSSGRDLELSPVREFVAL
jgi:hypothetical protein